VTGAALAGWRDAFLEGGLSALRTRARESGRLAIKDVFLTAEDRERLWKVHDLLPRENRGAPALRKAFVDAREDALWAQAVRRFAQVHAIARALFDLPD